MARWPTGGFFMTTLSRPVPPQRQAEAISLGKIVGPIAVGADGSKWLH